MATETKYSKDEAWLRIDGDTATIGITDYAQEQLNELVFVKLPNVGQRLTKGKEAATVESVKAASDIYSPVTGEVLEANPAIVSDPSLVNSDPMGAGVVLQGSNRAEQRSRGPDGRIAISGVRKKTMTPSQDLPAGAISLRFESTEARAAAFLAVLKVGDMGPED